MKKVIFVLWVSILLLGCSTPNKKRIEQPPGSVSLMMMKLRDIGLTDSDFAYLKRKAAVQFRENLIELGITKSQLDELEVYVKNGGQSK